MTSPAMVSKEWMHAPRTMLCCSNDVMHVCGHMVSDDVWHFLLPAGSETGPHSIQVVCTNHTGPHKSSCVLLGLFSKPKTCNNEEKNDLEVI